MKFRSISMSNVTGSKRLLRIFVITAFLSMLTIVILGVFGFYRIFRGHVTHSAEDDAINICRLLVDQQKNMLFHTGPDGRAELTIKESELYLLDQNLRHFLRYFDILKIKIYDISHTILYSTETRMIGRRDDQNRRLRNALAGNVDSKMETRERAHDLADESVLDVDVVETYVPIRNEAGTVVGSVEIYMNVTKYRSEVQRGVMVAFALLCMVTIIVFGVTCVLIRRETSQIKEMEAHLEQMSVTDMLTDLPNRTHLISRGEEQFERVRRGRFKGGTPAVMACIMIDIDNFKVINDTLGYQAGDQVLKEVARRINTMLRPYDVLGRYGGEEFVVFLPDTTFEQSLLVAERIRTSISQEEFVTDIEHVAVTVSLGVACSSENDTRINDLLKRSDEGLFKAKRIGRNRVAWVYNPFDSAVHG